MGVIAGWLAQVISFIMIVFFVRAIVSWLFVFGVRNEILTQINQALSAITEPILAPIRRYVPAAGGLDLSFLVVVFGLMFIRSVLLKIT
ncbi:MAG: YggT family protein [Chloroflexi bacterium]|nr:YggT family protein [Chloroflexota bacterium]MDA1173220.1 YggT family protein [Chloroflexota bacterium]